MEWTLCIYVPHNSSTATILFFYVQIIEWKKSLLDGYVMALIDGNLRPH